MARNILAPQHAGNFLTAWSATNFSRKGIWNQWIIT